MHPTVHDVDKGADQLVCFKKLPQDMDMLVLRLLVVLCMVFVPTLGHATTFYVSKTGSDKSGSGSANNPFATLQYAVNRLGPGDTCIVAEGRYREAVVMEVKGTVQAPVRIIAAEGAKVELRGSMPLSSWRAIGGNVYAAKMDRDLGSRNQVFSSGVMLHEAGWPNQKGALLSPSYAYASATGQLSAGAWFEDEALPVRPTGYWKGAVANIVGGRGWVMATTDVLDYDDTQRRLFTNYTRDGTAYSLIAGNEYYLFGVLGELDSDGEWYYDRSAMELRVYSSDGPPSNLEAKAREVCIDLGNSSYVHVEGIDFFACTVRTGVDSLHCSFRDLSMQYLSHSSRATEQRNMGMLLRGASHTLSGSDLRYSSGSVLTVMGDDMRIVNNRIRDGAYITHWWGLVNAQGREILIAYNTIDNAGRAALAGRFSRSLIQYNDIGHAGRITSDLGIVNLANQDGEGTRISRNLVHDNVAPEHTGYRGSGIYLDNLTLNFVVDHNIIWNGGTFALHFNTHSNYTLIANNTAFSPSNLMSTFRPEWDNFGTRVVNNILVDGWRVIEEGIVFISNVSEGEPGWKDPEQRDFSLSEGPGPALDTGVYITGVTTNVIGRPDIGALERGAEDWTLRAGHDFSVDRSAMRYSFDPIPIQTRLENGSFENPTLKPWITTGTDMLFKGNAWTDRIRLRTGYRSLKLQPDSPELLQTPKNLNPEVEYILSGSLRTDEGGDGVWLALRHLDGRVTQEQVSSEDPSVWTRVVIPFSIDGPTDGVKVALGVAPGNTGTVWVEDIGIISSGVMGNQPPFAHIEASADGGTAPLKVVFQGGGSTDFDGTLSAYLWDFGDGAVGSGARIEHTFDAAGEFVVQLTVVDNAGESTSVQIKVRVGMPLPAAEETYRPVVARAVGCGCRAGALGTLWPVAMVYLLGIIRRSRRLLKPIS